MEHPDVDVDIITVDDVQYVYKSYKYDKIQQGCEQNLYCQPQAPGWLLGPIDEAKVNSRVVRSRWSNAQAEPSFVLDN